MEGIKYFKEHEFKCPCCGGAFMDYEFVAKLDSVRRLCGFPLHVKSGWRCVRQNKKVDGVSDSQHLTGHAADVKRTMTPEGLFRLIKAATMLNMSLCVYDNFIHLDDRPMPRVWSDD